MLVFVLGILGFFSPSVCQAQQDSTYRIASDTIRLPPKLRVNADTGVYLQVRRIFIIGNRVTRDRIILRELSLHEGDIVNNTELPIMLDRDQKRLFNTHLFNTTSVRTLDLEPGVIDIVVSVNERWYTFPSPRFSLSDRNFNEWWQNYNHDFSRVIYGLKLTQYNMRGRNETLQLKALFGFQREFGLSYRIPYIDKKQKQGLIFNVEYTESKNVAYRTQNHILKYMHERSLLKTGNLASVTYTYRNSFYETHWIGAEYHNSFVRDTISELNPNYFGNSRTHQRYFSLSYQFVSDHRDVVSYPLTGYHFVFFTQKLGLTPRDNVNKFETNIVYTRYINLKNGFYFSNLSSMYWSTPSHQPYTTYGAMGYQKQFVKGYEIYVIEGPWYFLNKSTFKKRIFKKNYHVGLLPRGFKEIPLSIYLKSYLDLGYVQNYPFYQYNHFNTMLSNKLLSGVGSGFDIFASYDVVLRLEYTWTLQGNHGFFLHVKKEF